MNGEILVVNENLFQSFGDREKSNPECGKWKYADGVMMRGLFRKEAINLAVLLAEIHHAPDHLKELYGDSEGGSAFGAAGMMSGGNTIVGLIARSATSKRIGSSVVFRAIFKDGRNLMCSTTRAIFEELKGMSGVRFKTQEQFLADAEVRFKAIQEASLKKKQGIQ